MISVKMVHTMSSTVCDSLLEDLAREFAHAFIYIYIKDAQVILLFHFAASLSQIS